MSWNARRAVLADTGPLYAAADPSDQHHARAQRELKQLAGLKFDVVVPWPTLLEAQALVLHRLGLRRALLWLADIVPIVFLVAPDADDYISAVARCRAFPDQSLTIFDALVAVMARRLGLPVWTYDHHFDVMGVPVSR